MEECALMMAEAEAKTARRAALKSFKREALLAAARAVFLREGLEGATMRAIATEAGIAPGTLYLHYAGKEAIYGELLSLSLADLHKCLRMAFQSESDPPARLLKVSEAFYRFYRERPDALHLGLYLAQGLKPAGLTPELDRQLNGRLIQCFAVLGDAIRGINPLGPEELRRETVDLAAAVAGVLLLETTGRLKMLGDEGGAVLARQVERLAKRLRAAS